MPGIQARPLRTRLSALLVIALLLLPQGCHHAPAAGDARPLYAVTTSWLECALKDVQGDSVEIMRMCPPGTCPGHFDVSPRTLQKLSNCRALILFSFQQSIDPERLGPAASNLNFIPIQTPAGLTIPRNYLRACRELQTMLDKQNPEDIAPDRPKLVDVEVRLNTLETALLEQMRAAGLDQAHVVASGHQAAFCEWLGLKVVATYSGGEASSPAQLESMIQKGKTSGVRYVIANLQEGQQIGEALAWQFGARLVTLSNFPSMHANQDTFDELAAYNISQLVATVKEAP